jgi:HAD superfamily hydrolase (TIGR01509 family)
MPIQCVSFDVDDTLWDFAHMMHCGLAAVSETVTAWGAAYAHLTADAIAVRYREVAAVHDPVHMQWTELRRRLFVTLLTEAGHADPEAASRELIAHYLAVWKGSLKLYPGVMETLDALRGRFRLAWSTNGNFGPEVAGLVDYFDVVAMPHTVGVSKPDPVFMQFVADGAGCAPADILHVGDSLHSDVPGAQAAGAIAVWFNPHGKTNTSPHTPDHEITALHEVLALVEQLA